MPQKLQSVTLDDPGLPNAWRGLSGAARGIRGVASDSCLVVWLAWLLVWVGCGAVLWLVGQWVLAGWRVLSRLLVSLSGEAGRVADGVTIPPPSPQTSGE